MPRLDLSGPVARSLILGTGLGLMAVSLPPLWLKYRPAPAAAVAPPVPVRLPVATYDDGGPVAEPVHRTACPKPEQKEAAFSPLPDPGPPAAASMTPREAKLRLDRARMRAAAVVADLDELIAAVEAMTGEGVKP